MYRKFIFSLVFSIFLFGSNGFGVLNDFVEHISGEYECTLEKTFLSFGCLCCSNNSGSIEFQATLTGGLSIQYQETGGTEQVMNFIPEQLPTFDRLWSLAPDNQQGRKAPTHGEWTADLKNDKGGCFFRFEGPILKQVQIYKYGRFSSTPAYGFCTKTLEKN